MPTYSGFVRTPDNLVVMESGESVDPYAVRKWIHDMLNTWYGLDWEQAENGTQYSRKSDHIRTAVDKLPIAGFRTHYTVFEFHQQAIKNQEIEYLRLMKEASEVLGEIVSLRMLVASGKQLPGESDAEYATRSQTVKAGDPIYIDGEGNFRRKPDGLTRKKILAAEQALGLSGNAQEYTTEDWNAIMDKAVHGDQTNTFRNDK